MTRFLTPDEIMQLHRMVLDQSGGLDGVRDYAGIESAIAQAQLMFDGQSLYPTLGAKAAALGFSLICNHPFLDGNKRIGHAALEAFLLLNGWELVADVDEQEQVVLNLASGNLTREEFTRWLESRLKQVS